MEEKLLFELGSAYRDNMRIKGFTFGQGEKSICIVGATRGNEVQQVYICSQLVRIFTELEQQGRIREGKSILVIPTINSHSMNIGKRFWSTDNTDINRMFPGYSLGETTQRIAAGVFEQVNEYQFGIHFTSFYMQGSFIPHVRMMKTGFEDVERAKDFGLPYIYRRDAKPYDTTTLNYNWQIWETQAFSVCAGQPGNIDNDSARDIVSATLRFMALHGIIKCRTHPGYYSELQLEEELITVKARRAGILYCMCRPDESVRRDQVLARILDPYDGSIRWEARAPEDGTVFYVPSKPLVHENSVLFRIIPN